MRLPALLLASRKIVDGINWAQTLVGNEDVAKAVEKGKSAFVGPEIAGKTLGIIGLGAIGAQLANAATHLGMKVYGYDPYITVDAAWSLSKSVNRAKTLGRYLRKLRLYLDSRSVHARNKGYDQRDPPFLHEGRRASVESCKS